MLWVVGAGAAASGAVLRGERSRGAALRAVGPSFGLGLVATLGLALGVALACAVGADRGQSGGMRHSARDGKAMDPDPPTSEPRKCGQEAPLSGTSVPERGDGRDRHTRRWAERRTTASGRRSTVGPLIDYHPPRSPVGVRNVNGPTANGIRQRPVSRRSPGGTGKFGPHRIGPYDVECVRAPLTDQLSDGEIGSLGRPVPRRSAPALVERDTATAGRFHDVLDQLGRGASVGVAVGENEESGGEAVAADVRDLPGRAAVGGKLGGQWAAEECTAAVPFAVGAHKHHRFAGVRLPEAVMVSVSQGGEVESERGSRVGDGGGADPGTARRGVCEEHAAAGGAVEVGMAARAADEGDAYAGPFCCGFQGPAEVRIEVAVRQRLGSPWSGLLDQQPSPGGCGRSGEGFGRFKGSDSACAHKGEPNPEGDARNAGRVEGNATARGAGVSCLRYSGAGREGRLPRGGSRVPSGGRKPGRRRAGTVGPGRDAGT